jgi:hypothetical protein
VIRSAPRHPSAAHLPAGLPWPIASVRRPRGPLAPIAPMVGLANANRPWRPICSIDRGWGMTAAVIAIRCHRDEASLRILAIGEREAGPDLFPSPMNEVLSSAISATRKLWARSARRLERKDDRNHAYRRPGACGPSSPPAGTRKSRRCPRRAIAGGLFGTRAQPCWPREIASPSAPGHYPA